VLDGTVLQRRRKIEFHERSYSEEGGVSGTLSYRLTLARIKLERHLDVGDPRLQKLPSPLAEAETPVEPCRPSLRVERYPGQGAPAPCRSMASMSAAPTPRPRHSRRTAIRRFCRQAADAPSLSPALHVPSNRVIAALVPFVPFQLARHPCVPR